MQQDGFQKGRRGRMPRSRGANEESGRSCLSEKVRAQKTKSERRGGDEKSRSEKEEDIQAGPATENSYFWY